MSPVDPRIIAGGIQAGADLIGGLFGMSAQDKANAANLQIAQEYNQMQRDIAAQNNQLQYKMFQESNYYNSPAHQRKMLEEAGYNPYSLYSNPSGGASYAQSLPSLQQPQMAMPQVSPNFQFSNALQNAMGNAANVIKTLSEADKASSEKKLVDLNIHAFGDRLINELKLSGEQGKALELQNQLFADTYDQKKYRATIDNLLADADLVSKNQSIQRAAFDYQLQVAFGFKLKQKELDKLGSEIYRNIEEGKTSADQRLTNEVNRWALKKGVYQRDVELAINGIFAQAAKTQAGAAAATAAATSANLGVQTKQGRLNLAINAAQAKIMSAFMKFGNDPFTLGMRRNLMEFGFTPENLSLTQKMLKAQIKNTNSATERMKLQNLLDAINTGLNAIDQLTPKTHATSGFGDRGSYGQVTTDSYDWNSWTNFSPY